jgi:hypothetical protein
VDFQAANALDTARRHIHLARIGLGIGDERELDVSFESGGASSSVSAHTFDATAFRFTFHCCPIGAVQQSAKAISEHQQLFFSRRLHVPIGS